MIQYFSFRMSKNNTQSSDTPFEFLATNNENVFNIDQLLTVKNCVSRILCKTNLIFGFLMLNYPLYHKISKNTDVSTEKENFPTSFFYFAFFSKLGFLGIKNQFSAFFSAISSPIGLKIFFVRLQVIWVGRFFFFLDTFYQSSLAGFAKFLGSKKPKDIAKCSVFRSSLKYLEFLKKKNGHPDWVRLPTVKISAQTDEIYGFAGEKLFASF